MVGDGIDRKFQRLTPPPPTAFGAPNFRAVRTPSKSHATPLKYCDKLTFFFFLFFVVVVCFS